MDIIDNDYVISQIPLNSLDILPKHQTKDSDYLYIPIELSHYDTSDLIMSFYEDNDIEYDNVETDDHYCLTCRIDKITWGLVLYTNDFTKCFSIAFTAQEELILLRLLLQFNFFNSVK